MKYYFRKIDDERCYDVETILDMMQDEMEDNDLTKMTETVYEAEPIKDIDYFWCKEFDDVGEKGECGKDKCSSYEPRNGKNGICKHYAFCYQPSDKTRELTLELLCDENQGVKLERKKSSL